MACVVGVLGASDSGRLTHEMGAYQGIFARRQGCHTHTLSTRGGDRDRLRDLRYRANMIWSLITREDHGEGNIAKCRGCVLLGRILQQGMKSCDGGGGHLEASTVGRSSRVASRLILARDDKQTS
jgi:hypothetical protein